jgi:hypothetical protein
MKTFTPPSDQPSVTVIRDDGLKQTVHYTARDIALRGNMGSASFLQASGNSRKTALTRAEIVSQVQAKHRAEEKAERVSMRSFPRATFAPRIANVRRVSSINGFHAIGLGRLSNLTLNELKVKLGVNGFSGYRIGGLTFKLFGVK